MGSGVGISLYGTHRVAGERYRFAMPETGIGLFPDDGVAWAFARMPDEIGMYLALTGRAVGRADAYRLGLATHCIPAARFERDSRRRSPTPILSTRPARRAGTKTPAPASSSAARRHRPLLLAPTAWRHHRAPASGDAARRRTWAQGVFKDLRARSPTSLKITHRHVRAARALDLRATLKQDFRLGLPVPGGSRFLRGRAGRADRPGPRPEVAAGTAGGGQRAMVEGYFASLGPDELELPSRAEMQASALGALS